MGPASLTLICVCDEDWCWCGNTVEPPDWVMMGLREGRLTAPPDIACEECRGGHHLSRPFGERGGPLS